MKPSEAITVPLLLDPSNLITSLLAAADAMDEIAASYRSAAERLAKPEQRGVR